MEPIKFECNKIVYYDINDLKPYPKNDKLHPPDENLILRLMKIFKENGFRNPIKINASTNMITAGHARIEALKRLGVEKVPCIPQYYENSDLEFADIVADNATNEWRRIELSAINIEIGNLDGISFDIDTLGIKDFEVEPMDKKEKKEKEKIECPSCGYIF